MKNCIFYFKLFIIIIIIIFALYNTVNKYNTNTENFTPKIREMYRPYLRHARVTSEGFYGDGENNINRLFRKFGLY